MMQTTDKKIVRLYWNKSKQEAFECPWCGRKKIFLWKSHTKKFKRYSIGCSWCYVSSEGALTKKGAVRKWDRFYKRMKKNSDVHPAWL